jgi:hypothetical protein
MAGSVSDGRCVALRLLDDNFLRQFHRAGLIDAVVLAATEQIFRYGWM